MLSYHWWVQRAPTRRWARFTNATVPVRVVGRCLEVVDEGEVGGADEELSSQYRVDLSDEVLDEVCADRCLRGTRNRYLNDTLTELGAPPGRIAEVLEALAPLRLEIVSAADDGSDSWGSQDPTGVGADTRPS